jgi:hypothetical protein
LDLEKYMLPCISRTLFGVECLGCGFQRALALLFRGQYAASFHMYPALFTNLLFLGFIGFHFINRRLFSQKLILTMALINVIFMIAGYIYKHY